MSEFTIKLDEAKNWFDKYAEGHASLRTAFGIYDEFNEYKLLIEKIPDSDTELKSELEDRLIEPITLFINSLGPSLNVNRTELEYSGATASSGSVYLLNDIQKYKPKEDEWISKFRSEAFTLVKNIQRDKASVNYLQEKFNFLHSPLCVEFKELVGLHIGYISSIEYASSFGIKMRNVIEHFKGICNKAAVIEKYGSYKDSDEPLTWSKISEYIAIGGKGSKYDNLFSKNSSIYVEIHRSLSSDAKNYTVVDIEKLPNTFVKTVQYLESSIKLIDLDKIKNHLSK